MLLEKGTYGPIYWTPIWGGGGKVNHLPVVEMQHSSDRSV